MFTRKTLLLFGVAAALGLATLAPTGGVDPSADLPTLAGVDRDAVTRVEITQGQLEKVVILGSLKEGWRVTQPYDAPADAMLLRTLLNQLREPVVMDVRLDEGNLETYGLDDQNGVLVELFTDGETPAFSIVVGGDMPGGFSFVRLKDSEEVFRARVGGRSRYARDTVEWQNRMAVQVEPELVAEITLAQPSGELRFWREIAGTNERGEASWSPWRLAQDPALALNQDAVTDLVTSLSVVRAGTRLGADFDGGFDQPAARVELRLNDGSTRVLTFGGRESAEGAFLKVSGEDVVYAVAKPKRDAALAPLAALLDNRILRFTREEVDRLRLEDGGVPVVLESGGEQLWRVAEPKNVDADVKLILFTVNILADLRSDGAATGVSLADAGLSEPGQVITVYKKDGGVHTVEVGRTVADDQGRLFYYVRVDGGDAVHLLRDQTLNRIRAGFGRGA
ncbi:DUF4340 domain-containing protein [Myxococcota bacterium]|nr:DUF4340 domain-containing protein [Myxococcota bacterium]